MARWTAANISSLLTFHRLGRIAIDHTLSIRLASRGVSKRQFSRSKTMRKVIYGGAMSLDGYIAGPHGEHDWIVMDPDLDFAAFAARFDTYLIGRKTFEALRAMGSEVQSIAGIQHL